MEHCPSHDWDRYCDEQERSAGLNWLAEVSEKIKQAYPYWKVEIDPDRAFADDEIIIWNDGTRIIQPYDPETLEPDEAAIVVRTLHKQGLSANVFPLSKYDPTKVWAVFIWHPEASWLV
ncbi:MAG TPA: hypothetical protein V6C65_39370, partial [Allocoleopsis sp.]